MFGWKAEARIPGSLIYMKCRLTENWRCSTARQWDFFIVFAATENFFVIKESESVVRVLVSFVGND